MKTTIKKFKVELTIVILIVISISVAFYFIGYAAGINSVGYPTSPSKNYTIHKEVVDSQTYIIVNSGDNIAVLKDEKTNGTNNNK